VRSASEDIKKLKDKATQWQMISSGADTASAMPAPAKVGCLALKAMTNLPEPRQIGKGNSAEAEPTDAVSDGERPIWLNRPILVA
jgi:hypothetical protein